MIEINNLTNFAVNKKFFLGVAKRVLKGENKESENLSIAFVSAPEIQKLNKRYRKKDAPTDVLSFDRVSDFKDEVVEVIVSPEIVRANAKESRLSLKKELAKIIIHGILHALGYDHERSEKEATIMASKEKFYFSKI